MSDTAARLARAETLLHEHGFAGARVRAAGAGGNIAAVSVTEPHLAALLGEARDVLAEQLRALGFQYVAVDLDLAG